MLLDKVVSGVIVVLSTVSIFTKFEHQDIGFDPEYLKRENYYLDESKVQVGVYFSGARKERGIIFPLFLTKYKCAHDEYKIKIKGPLTGLKLLEAYFLIDGEKFLIPIEKSKWNEKQVEGAYIAEHLNTLDIDWNDLKEIDFFIKFIVHQGTKKTMYEKLVDLEYRNTKFYNNFLIQWFVSLT